MNLKRIKDSVLFRKTVTVGNLNDFINLSNSVSSDVDIEEISVLLKEKGAKDGDKFDVVLTKEPIKGSILDYAIDSLYLSFIPNK